MEGDVLETSWEPIFAGWVSMLLGTLGANLLGNILFGGGINRAGEGIVRTIKWVFNAASSFD